MPFLKNGYLKPSHHLNEPLTFHGFVPFSVRKLGFLGKAPLNWARLMSQGGYVRPIARFLFRGRGLLACSVLHTLGICGRFLV